MYLVNHPILLFALAFVVMSLSARFGSLLRYRFIHPLKDEERDDYSMVVSAILTLLGLLIGFTFSMAINRYELRKNCEEAEANAISTEYVRADLLPAPEASKVRELLRKYLDQRVLFYETRDPADLAKINATTAQLQKELWSAILPVAQNQPTPPAALVVSGMNDVLNTQGYTQAAWWNRIPVAAWGLMATIAVCCNLLIGYGVRWTNRNLLFIVPVAVSVSFFLISDIDSPRGGAIRIMPKNLESLAQSLRAP